MRIIIESDDEAHMVDQAKVAYLAISSGEALRMQPGDILGMRFNGSYYGVRRNVDSLRIYLQRGAA